MDAGGEPEHVDAEAELFAEVDEAMAAEEAPELVDAAAVQSATLPTGDVNADDREFIRRVFNQVKDVDFRTPPPPPPKGLDGPEKKLHDLREKVRRLERDLARVGSIWTTKQDQVDALDQILTAKEVERSKAVNRALRFKDQASKLIAHHKQEAEALKALLNTLTAKKGELDEALRYETAQHASDVRDLEARLAQEEADKAALHADFVNKMEAAQAAFAQLREQSARSIQNLETQIQNQADQLLQSDEKLMTRDRSFTALADKLTERENAATQLAEDISRIRAESDQRVDEVRERLRAAEEQSLALQRDLGAAQSDLRALRESLDKREAELEALKKAPPA